MPKHVKGKHVAESVENLMTLKDAKVRQLNAANAMDLMKYGTGNYNQIDEAGKP
jgi:hypothetical protein